jgi:hypothetical protein
MDRPPTEQAHHLRHKLLDRLRELNCRPPASGVAVCFPDVAFSEPPTQDDHRDVVIGQR